MAKKNKSFLPKKIAGVKVPKAVRKGRFGELLASPAGQRLLAEAVVAVGAVAGAKKVKDSPTARGALAGAAYKLRDTGDQAGRGASEAGGVLAYALGEAARSFTEALRRTRDDDSDHLDLDDRGSDAADDSKKKSSYEAGPL